MKTSCYLPFYKEQVLAATYHRLRDLFTNLGYHDPIGHSLQLVNNLRFGASTVYQDASNDWPAVRLSVCHREHREVREVL